jgi:hypothetical protein
LSHYLHARGATTSAVTPLSSTSTSSPGLDFNAFQPPDERHVSNMQFSDPRLRLFENAAWPISQPLTRLATQNRRTATGATTSAAFSTIGRRPATAAPPPMPMPMPMSSPTAAARTMPYRRPGTAFSAGAGASIGPAHVDASLP